MTQKPPFKIEEWNDSHPRWQEFIACIRSVAAEQEPFVVGDRYRAYDTCLLVAIQDEEVVGFLRFAVQPIGPEAKCPEMRHCDMALTEAKIHAFAVSEERRCQGVGTALQQRAITRAEELGCYQLASHSSYQNEANCKVKLSLGFAAQPEKHTDDKDGVYFLMPLRKAATVDTGRAGLPDE
jgi:GNAT superfamily N-acetyltransferase